MAMPKTAVNLDDGLESGEYQIGASGEILGVKPIPQACMMQVATDQQFGLGVLAPNC